MSSAPNSVTGSESGYTHTATGSLHNKHHHHELPHTGPAAQLTSATAAPAGTSDMVNEEAAAYVPEARGGTTRQAVAAGGGGIMDAVKRAVGV